MDPFRKTGRANTGGASKIPDVNSLPCPSREDLDRGPHELQTTSERGNPVTRCVWCRVPWATLDARLRATV